MDISQGDQERISAAIRDVETRTSSDIVCVVARSSADARALPIFVAAVAALMLPWILVALTRLSVHQILLLQVFLFFALTLILCTPRVRVALIPRVARRAVAHRVAMEQFVIRGLAAGEDDRACILIFVSLAERYARIIASKGIADRVPRSDWQSAVDSLVAHVRAGHIADGLTTAIDKCGAILEKHFPRSQADNWHRSKCVFVI